MPVLKAVMRRAVITGFASLLVVAVIPPAAQGATQVRHFQGDLAPPAFVNDGGELGLRILFKNKRSNRKRFTPRLLTLIDLERVPLRCAGPPGGPASQSFLTTSTETRVKLTKSPPPAGTSPKASRYSFNFRYSFTTFTGTIAGKVFKANGRGQPKANGSLNIEDLDFSGSGPNNCSTNGPRGWSAFQCRTPNEGGSLPICRVGGGS
jgi:hypothetical protein